MSEALPRDPRSETTEEVVEAQKLRSDFEGLRRFWNRRYETTYGAVLEGPEEFGRHGVIAEYIQRTVPTGNVLDVGCGTGILAELLDVTRYNYIGVDISDHALGIARSKPLQGNVEFVHAAIEDYDPGVPVNAIVLNEVLYYLDYAVVHARLKSLLAEPYLVVASLFDFPEGTALISTLRKSLEASRVHVIESPELDLKWTVIAGRLGGAP